MNSCYLLFYIEALAVAHVMSYDDPHAAARKVPRLLPEARVGADVIPSLEDAPECSIQSHALLTRQCEKADSMHTGSSMLSCSSLLHHQVGDASAA